MPGTLTASRTHSKILSSVLAGQRGVQLTKHDHYPAECSIVNLDILELTTYPALGKQESVCLALERCALICFALCFSCQ